MPRTYKAVLRGNHLEWVNNVPNYKEDQPINVEVSIVEKNALSENDSRGEKMAEILEKLAESKAFSEIRDPLSWQREIRKERQLPDRGD